MLLLDIPQLAHEPIVLGVRCGGGVEDVVLVVGAVDLFAEPVSPCREIVM